MEQEEKIYYCESCDEPMTEEQIAAMDEDGHNFCLACKIIYLDANCEEL